MVPDSVTIRDKNEINGSTVSDGTKLSTSQKKRLRQKRAKDAKTADDVGSDGNSQASQGPVMKDGISLPKLEYLDMPGQKYFQTMPPTLPMTTLFPKRKYPRGLEMMHPDEGCVLFF
ncbi:hypothetical protein BLNAU_6712 [Blattamonas nauphoetae]|uniref:Uncharacterized protein n=1 Tax=Blattamonas nauphoetae TaxID=2049346 RepID=A0ABQ9Y3A2_9EUKA|nr:hypothetical protein BLNAU_6712 [Blattamonas nauphoetae]